MAKTVVSGGLKTAVGQIESLKAKKQTSTTNRLSPNARTSNSRTGVDEFSGRQASSGFGNTFMDDDLASSASFNSKMFD